MFRKPVGGPALPLKTLPAKQYVPEILPGCCETNEGKQHLFEDQGQTKSEGRL